MSETDFQKFRKAVLSDSEQMSELANICDPAQFKETAVIKAAAIGLDLTGEDLDAAMHYGRRSWIERWI